MIEDIVASTPVEIRYRNDAPGYDENGDPVLVSVYMFKWEMGGRACIEAITLDEDIGVVEAHARHWDEAEALVLEAVERYEHENGWSNG